MNIQVLLELGAARDGREVSTALFEFETTFKKNKTIIMIIITITLYSGRQRLISGKEHLRKWKAQYSWPPH